MNIKELKELIGLIENSGIEEFEMEKSGVRIRVRKQLSGSKGVVSVPAPADAGTVAETANQTSLAPAQAEEKQEEKSFSTFLAPMVGTFYITPKPDADPFVQVSDRVKKGTVLCTIEAMKIFNQIESDVDGEIVEILVENGQPVEYGQPLFRIRVSS